MDCSMPGFPVHHQLPELAQTHVHRVGDAIQPSHPLSSPSPPAFNPSQHQGLFQWVPSSHQVAKVLEFQFQHQSFQWIFRLISFRINWVDLLAVQGTLKGLLQYSSEASVLAINIQDWNLLGLAGLISLLSKGLSRVFSNTTFKSIKSSVLNLPHGPTLTFIHD